MQMLTMNHTTCK